MQRILFTQLSAN